MNSQFWQSYNLMVFCEFCLVSIALLKSLVLLQVKRLLVQTEGFVLSARTSSRFTL